MMIRNLEIKSFARRVWPTRDDNLILICKRNAPSCFAPTTIDRRRAFCLIPQRNFNEWVILPERIHLIKIRSLNYRHGKPQYQRRGSGGRWRTSGHRMAAKANHYAIAINVGYAAGHGSCLATCCLYESPIQYITELLDPHCPSLA
jgi:hypothetical protein